MMILRLATGLCAIFVMWLFFCALLMPLCIRINGRMYAVRLGPYQVFASACGGDTPTP